MMLLVLLLLQYCDEGFPFTLPNGNVIPGVPSSLINALPSDFPKGLFNGQPTGMMNIPSSFLNGGVQAVPKEGNFSKENNTCCFGTTCLSPCPFNPGPANIPIAIPMPPIPQPSPILVPARTYYEPVVHDHPTLSKIRNIIRRGKGRKKERYRYTESSDTDCSESDLTTDSDSTSLEDSRIDYHEDVIHVRV